MKNSFLEVYPHVSYTALEGGTCAVYISKTKLGGVEVEITDYLCNTDLLEIVYPKSTQLLIEIEELWNKGIFSGKIDLYFWFILSDNKVKWG